MKDPRSEIVVKIEKPYCSTKERILDAALKLFSQKGYLGATTKEIAATAVVAEPTLFRYFENKERLLDAVIGTSAFFSLIEAALSKAIEMPYERALAMFAEQFLQIFDSRKDLIRVMKWEMHRNPRVRRMYYSMLNKLIKTWACYFHEMQLRGLLIEFNAESGALAFIGILMSFFNIDLPGGRNKYKGIDGTASITDCVRIFARGTLASDAVQIGSSTKDSMS